MTATSTHNAVGSMGPVGVVGRLGVEPRVYREPVQPPTQEIAIPVRPDVEASGRQQQRWLRLAVGVWLVIAVGLTVVALITARSPGGPVETQPTPVNVAGASPLIGTAGLVPSLQPPPQTPSVAVGAATP